ncbi:MAG TPA: class I SAM-dependent methyltransferase [Aliidongia sp.]|nr:class I SAM-dependent methyltransferase [Aliidongia sp.]
MEDSSKDRSAHFAFGREPGPLEGKERAMQFRPASLDPSPTRVLRRLGAGLSHLARRRLRGSPLRVLRRWREWREETALDRRFGTDTSGRAQLDELSFESENKIFGITYMATPAKLFFSSMQCLPRDLSDYTFVDFGCGKGRALLNAAEYGFKQIIGVEFSPQLAEIAKRNVELYGTKTGNRRLVVTNADATLFDIPAGNCVLYFFNPFSIEVSSIVFRNIMQSLMESPRAIFIIWCYVTDAALPLFRSPDFIPYAGQFAPGPPWPEKGFIVFRGRNAPLDFLSALGLRPDSPETRRIIRKYSLTDRYAASPSTQHYGSPAGGMNLVAEGNRVVAIQIHVRAAHGYGPYEDTLPFELRSHMDRQEVDRLLGPPTVSDELGCRYERSEIRATLTLRFDPASRLAYIEIAAWPLGALPT